MPPKLKQIDGQELLFPSAATGQIGEFSTNPEEGVGLVARNLHLINVIDTIGHIAQLEGLEIKATTQRGQDKLANRYGLGIDAVLHNVSASRTKLFNKVRWEFARADGMFARIDAELQTPEEAKAQTKADLKLFMRQYGNLRNGPERGIYRAQLVNEIESLQDERTVENREQHARPHIPDYKRTETLTDQERLQAISADPRAGFLPTTHTEKTTVLAYLDYMDNPDYPLGVRNQTLEIGGYHHKKANKPGANWKVGRENAIQAAWSKTYELGDFLYDAHTQLGALKELQEELVNPKLTLCEAVGAEHIAYAALTRFIDLSRLRDKGEKPSGLPHHPLHPFRNESSPDLSEYDHKNKIIEDPYTHQKTDPEFVDRIQKMPHTLTVKEARKPLNAAIDDAERRRLFMLGRLHEFAATTHKEQVLFPAAKAAGIVLLRYADIESQK